MERHGTRFDLPSPVAISPNLLDTVLHRDAAWAFYYERDEMFELDDGQNIHFGDGP
jgi:hypothetical protein